MRQLASVQRITDIRPIDGADAIECARVLGWDVVVKKGEFQPGDLAVYMEIDSVPPDEEQYRFLWKNTEMRPNNFRIRTVKLRGQISQGILFQTKQLHEGGDFPDRVYINGAKGQEQGALRCVGDDVSELLGVTKYEPPLPTGSDDIEGQFFDGVPKTDEERVQSSTGAQHLAALQGRNYYITVKCDGSSMTVASHDGQVKIASRNYRLAKNVDSPYWRAAYNSEGLLDMVHTHPEYAVQGELVGPGIQGNRLGLTEHYCLVFDIFDRSMGRYLSLLEIRALEFDWGFNTVPLVEYGDCFTHSQESLLALAEGKYPNTTNEREGIVIRNAGTLDRVSFKVISNRFLLKGGD